MKLTRREFLSIGVSLALAGCGKSGVEEEAPKTIENNSTIDKVKANTAGPETDAEEEPEPQPSPESTEEHIVEETTYYDVFRADMREGIFGDVEVYTIDTADFSDYYAVLNPDGTFSFDIYGVNYNGSIELGETTKHLYSGIEDSEVTRVLFDGTDTATVGTVDIEGFYVDNYFLIELMATVDGEFNDITFYLWKHVDE